MNIALFKKISGIFILVCIANADVVNITVDDTYASILYQPPNSWSEGKSCSTCAANVEQDLAYGSTWHDITYFPDKSPELDAEFNFTGIGVYVYCILSNSQDGITAGTSDMLFFVDDELSNEFYREADALGPKFVYNASVFANTSFADGEHKLLIRNGRPDRGLESIMLLDRIIYTKNQNQSGQSNSRSSAKIAGIVGGTLGGVGCLLLLACGWIWFRRRGGHHAPHISPWRSHVNV